MTINQVIEELPKLSSEDRRSICRRIIELEPEQDDIEMCERIASEGFSMLDAMEAEDARDA